MSKQRFGGFTAARLALIPVVLAIVAVATIGAFAAAPASPSSQTVAQIWLDSPSAILTGHDIFVSGGIVADADLTGAVVGIFKREAGEGTDTHVTDAVVSNDKVSGNVFKALVPAVTRNCVITASWAGNADYLASSTWVFAGVKPKLTLAVKSATRRQTKFRIVVSPGQPFYKEGPVLPPLITDVQCRVHGVWTVFPVKRGGWSTDGESWWTYRYSGVKPGKYLVRAHFQRTNYNVARVSAAQRLVVP
jgi:hypothetical protein